MTSGIFARAILRRVWHPWLRLVLRLAAITAVSAGLSATIAMPAQSADPVNIEEGMRLFLQKGNCQACHGWAGDGRKTDDQMPDGANLRESALDRDLLILTIRCGRPGRDMPAYDRLAYSDGRCYGMKQADLISSGSRLPDPPATLQPREIDLIADFMTARIVGKGPMDHAKCVEFWGSDVDACRDLPK